MTRPAVLAAALLAAGTLTLTACGHSDDPASHLTACQVITKSDIHQVIPDMAVTPPPTDSDTKHVCLYSDLTDGGGIDVTVTFESDTGTSGYQHDERSARAKSGARVKSLTDIGDEAFSYVSGDGATIAAETRVEDATIEVTVRNYVTDGTRSAVALVRRGIHRVKGAAS